MVVIWRVLVRCGGHRNDRRRFWQADYRGCELVTQFVPGHVHLRDLGKLVAEQLKRLAALPKSSTPLRWMMGCHGPRGDALFTAISRTDR